MIVFLVGVVDYITDDSLYLSVSGVGYEVFVSSRVLSTVSVGDSVKVYTYHYVRDDDIRLFGFLSMRELAIFSLLISVNGVGPKAGIAILSAYSVDDVIEALARGDERFFASVSGVGKKSAAKIVIELKDKLQNLSFSSSDTAASLHAAHHRDLVDAMLALGYSEREVFRHLHSIDMTQPLSLQIKQMLGVLGK